jgi:carbamoyl-phosphate synthase large subunit
MSPMDDAGATSVLVSSAGRRVELLRSFRSALVELGLDGQVVAADRSWYSSAFHIADRGVIVPSCDAPDFVDRMLEHCGEHRVGLIVPTIDPELAVYAEAGDRFAATGVVAAVSSPEVVAIAADKVATNDWLRRQGFPTVRQASVDRAAAWSYPFVVKPRFGSAGLGVAVVADAAELAVAARAGEVVAEEQAPGYEYTIDCFVDRSGRCRCAVPRRRIEVRAGEVSKGVTVRSARLEALAAAVCDALPGAFGAVTIQVFVDGDPERGSMAVIEINPRFGGGYPLSHAAGADFPRWLLEEATGRTSTATADRWRSGLVMLRYDAAVFVEEPPG